MVPDDALPAMAKPNGSPDGRFLEHDPLCNEVKRALPVCVCVSGGAVV